MEVKRIVGRCFVNLLEVLIMLRRQETAEGGKKRIIPFTFVPKPGAVEMNNKGNNTNRT